MRVCCCPCRACVCHAVCQPNRLAEGERSRPVSAVMVLHDPLDWALEAQVVVDVLRGGTAEEPVYPTDTYPKRKPRLRLFPALTILFSAFVLAAFQRLLLTPAPLSPHAYRFKPTMVSVALKQLYVLRRACIRRRRTRAVSFTCAKMFQQVSTSRVFLSLPLFRAHHSRDQETHRGRAAPHKRQCTFPTRISSSPRCIRSRGLQR